MSKKIVLFYIILSFALIVLTFLTFDSNMFKDSFLLEIFKMIQNAGYFAVIFSLAIGYTFCTFIMLFYNRLNISDKLFIKSIAFSLGLSAFIYFVIVSIAGITSENAQTMIAFLGFIFVLFKFIPWFYKIMFKK